jgi:hypothetical protein
MLGKSGARYLPWTLPAMIRIERNVPWLNEEWTCTFKEVTPPFDDFTFEIVGSKTGNDGVGRASEDFISKSKRVIIKKGDAGAGGGWHLKRSYQVLKTKLKAGDVVKWKTYSISTDLYTPQIKQNRSAENITTIFQGIPDKEHVLTIKSTSKGIPIKEIRVYKPYLQ